MADNTDEEHLANQANNQSENLPDEITPAKDTKTITQNQETENMEVHHHPNLHHKPKPLKEYFLEFLMIFLAVTMGFFAENIREHFAEKKITKEYLETFEQELEHNKKVFRTFDSIYASIMPLQDSTANLFFRKKENDNLRTTASLVSQINIIVVPSIDVSAYQQLVNSGGLRYIHNIALKDTMSLYFGQIQYFETYNSGISSSIVALQSQIASLEDVHDAINRTNIPEILPYPALTERERRMMVSYYRTSYIQSFGDKFLLKYLNDINEKLLKMIKNELNN